MIMKATLIMALTLKMNHHEHDNGVIIHKRVPTFLKNTQNEYLFK